MRSIAARFMMAVSVVFVLFSGFVAYHNYADHQAHVRKLMDRQAALALEFDIAIRDYLEEEIRPLLNELPDSEDVWLEMSSVFATRSIFKTVRDEFPDCILRFSSDNPRNPTDQATPDELKVIEYFNANPQVERWTGTMEVDGKQHVAYFGARRMKENCKGCHGQAKDAPTTVVERYGTAGGFDYPLGAVIALDMIAIPSGSGKDAVLSEITQESAIIGAGLVAVLVLTMLMFRFVVARRLGVMTTHFERIATQPDSTQIAPVEVGGCDEISTLAGGFNTLVSRLNRAHATLEQQVEERTRALEESRKALRATRDRAEDANRAKGEFLANMSHEIRTPMTAILGYAEVLHEDILCCTECPRHTTCELRIENEERVQTIMRNGEHLLQLINDILDLSKVDAGRLEIESVSFSPLRVVTDVASMMRVRADAKGLELQVEFRGPIPEAIQSDPTRLRQILVNLAGNAIKFTQSGSIRLVTSVVGLDSDNPTMQFEVIDAGMGIAPEQLATLFQPFVQADTSTTRKFGGSGLGLAISKRLAEKLGGDLIVESRPGRGSLFRVTVTTGPLDGAKMIADPLSATILDTEGAAGSCPRGAAQAEACGSPKLDCRILLVEDSPDNQRLISHVLNKAGAEVTVVENGELAADAALAGRDPSSGRPSFDCILMDMQMPVMDGYAATRLLREKGYEGPILALTAHAMAGDRDKCLRAGCDDFASKPINRAKLIELIRQYVRVPTEAVT